MARIEINLIGDLKQEKVSLCSWKYALKETSHLSSFYGHLISNAFIDKNTDKSPIYLLDKTSTKILANHYKDSRVMTFDIIGQCSEVKKYLRSFNTHRVKKENDAITLRETLRGALENKPSKAVIKCFISPIRLPELLKLANELNYDVVIEIRTLNITKPRSFLKLKYNFLTLMTKEKTKWKKFTVQTSMGVMLYEMTNLKPSTRS